MGQSEITLRTGGCKHEVFLASNDVPDGDVSTLLANDRSGRRHNEACFEGLMNGVWCAGHLHPKLGSPFPAASLAARSKCRISALAGNR